MNGSQNLKLSVVLIAILALSAQLSLAQDKNVDIAPSKGDHGDAGPQGREVEVVSANGSVTRAKCPHSCVDRKIPQTSCREWRSKMYPDVCYVEDLRKPSDAVPLGYSKEKRP